MYVNWKVERYARTGDSTWSATPIELSDFYDILIRMSLGDGKDTFSFKQTNFNNELDDYWNIGDKVVLSYKVNDTASASDIVMNGIVTNIPNEDSYNNNFIRVEGNNYSETLMSALVFYAPNGATNLVSYLQEALNSIALYNENFKVTWNGDNPSVKIDDVTAFPTYDERWFYKSFLKLLEKYSTNSYTDDGNYYWYVNVDNELVWRPKTQGITASFNQTTDDYNSLKTKKDIKGVVNFVIAKGGLSPAMKPITIKYDNAVSRAKHGFKYKLLISEHNTANNLMLQDGLLGQGSTTRYPTSYSYVTKWSRIDTGATITVANDAEYDDAIRDEVKRRLKREAKEYVTARKDGKLMIELSFINGKGWTIGDNINTTIADIGFANKPMRVKEVELTNSGERYTLEEDEGTI